MAAITKFQAVLLYSRERTIRMDILKVILQNVALLTQHRPTDLDKQKIYQVIGRSSQSEILLIFIEPE